MSNTREQPSGESESEAVVAWLSAYYHYVLVGLLAGFIAWNRGRNWSNFVVDGELFFRGNDPWYHYRMTQYTVRNFPATMPFDPWTYFPYGTFTQQFGTIFDQLIALVALIVGLGNPDSQTVGFVFLFAPVGFALAIIVPGYVVGRRLGGRFGGVLSVAIIAFAADRLLQVTLAGNVQHESAEAVFMSLGVLGVMVALTAAEKDKPVYELLVAREFDALRRPLAWSMLSGVAISVYVWTWPPGMWLYGILAVFFVIHLSVEHVRKRSPEHAAFVGVTTLLTVGLLQIGFVRTLELGATQRSLLQPGFAIAVAAGILFLAWLSRFVESRDQPVYAYPAAVAVSILTAATLMYLLTPGLFDFFLSQTDRVLGFVTSPGTTAGTIGEATPMRPGRLFDFYKLAFVTAVAGAVLILFRQIYAEDPRGEELLIVVWFVFVVLASLTQVRFAYYLTIPVAGLNAVLVGPVMKAVGSADRDPLQFETYEILTVATVILLIVIPMAVVSPTPVAAADSGSFPGDSVAWDDNLDWMEENTPEPGQYGHPDNEPMAYYAEYDGAEDYEYQAGSYGVMSWWDYGHWITTEAERIPNANPFQEGSDQAARVLLAQNETAANDELSAVDEHDDAKTRYLMVDWRMVETESQVGGKFFAPPDFHDNYTRSDFYTRLMTSGQQDRLSPVGIAHKQAYYQSLMVRLYHYHGSAQDPQPFVVQWQGQERKLPGIGDTYVETNPQQQPVVRFFEDVESAQEYAAESETARVGGIGPYPEERVPALKNYRLVYTNNLSALAVSQREITAAQSGANFNRGQVSQRDAQILAQGARAPFQDQRQALNYLHPTTPSFTKTFERVPGATIEGEGPPNTEVAIRVPMKPENGDQFVYNQRVETDANGEFTTTVPYSTQGYDEWGVEEGYTNVNVRAVGPYTAQTGVDIDENGTATTHEAEFDVSEGQVIGEDDSPVTITLEETTFDAEQAQNGGQEAANDSSTGDDSTGDGTADEETAQ